MKKKLIAALTSAAMVATMVPATAFATTGQQPVNTKPDTEVTERAATVKDVSDFTTAMSNLPDLDKMTAWNRSIDALVVDACEEYAKLASADAGSITEETATLKQYVEKLWDLRIEAITDVQNKVDTENIDADNLEDAKTFIELYDDFIDAYTSKVMYKILGTDPMDSGKVDGLNLTETLSDVNEAITSAVAVKNYKENYGFDKIVNAVEAITKVEPVNDLNYNDFNGSSAVSNVNTQYTAAKNAGVEGRVGNYDWFKQQQAKVTEYQNKVSEIDAEIAKIAAVISPGNLLTKDKIDDYEAAYKAALNAFNSLDKDGWRGLQDDVNKTALETAKDNIDNYKKGIEKEATVTSLLNALPDKADVKASDALQIMRAQVAYDALTPVAGQSGGAATGTIANLAAGFQANIDRVAKAKLDNAVEALQAAIYSDGTGKPADEDAVKAAVEPLIAEIDALTANSSKEAAEELDNIVGAYATLGTELTTALKEASKKLETVTKEINKNADAVKEKIKVFTDAVDAIGKAIAAPATDANNDEIADTNEVNNNYIGATVTARDAYNALDSSLTTKEDVIEALKKLEIAETNVAAYRTFDQVKTLIMAVPTAKTLDVTDTAAVEKVKAAKSAFDALTKGVQGQVETAITTDDNANNTTYWQNFQDAVAKVTKAENQTVAEAVESAIKALPELPKKEFTSLTEIEAAKAAMDAAEKAYQALTPEQQKEVSNYNDLTAYKTSYQTKADAYAQKLYDEVKNIDTTQDLSKADAAKIAELVTLIENEYANEPASMNQNTYKALKEAVTAFQAEVGDLSKATVDAIADQTYTGSPITPTVVVKDSTGDAIDASQYTVICENNVSVGTAKVTIFPSNGSAYTGVKEVNFEIKAASINDATVAVDNQTYTGAALKPAVTVTVNGKALTSADYTAAYSNNTNAGTAKVTITGKGNYTGTASKDFTIAKANIKNATVTGVANRYFTGKKRTQTDLKVTIAGKTVNKANYSVTYKNNKNVGKATLTITGKDNYTGTVTKNFVIKPRKVSNVKVTKGKKRVTVRYKKQDGARYQIYYKTAGSKYKTVKTTAVKRTIKKLKSGKRYTIKVRAYKKIGNKTYYGKYSAAKKVTVR